MVGGWKPLKENQVGQGLEQPDLMEGVPALGKGLE